MARDRDDDDDRDDDRPRRRRDRDEYDDEYDDRPRARRRSREDDDDRDDRPRRRGAVEPPSNGPAMTSLVLGIISLVGGLTAIPGLICGFVGLSKAKKLGGAGKGMAITGTALSAVGLLVLGLTVWGVIWFVGKREETRERMIASNNLKQIGLAMHSHHDANNSFPSGVANSPQNVNGRPIPPSELSTRLSWRVDLLPYIEQDSVYRLLNTSEPWDSAKNRPVSLMAIQQYSDVEDRKDPDTRWRVFYGEQTPFDPSRGRRSTMVSITDGTSNTIMVVESGDKVTWTRFAEIPFDPNNPPSPSTFGRAEKDTFQVLMFDGSVKILKKSMSQQTFKHAITPNGGEVFDFDR